ncbi:MAG: gamma-glutamyltransferase, partial [Roseomonas mucosa]|nr:gamma-glutamyltransferase [Roseomonas mucosa]
MRRLVLCLALFISPPAAAQDSAGALHPQAGVARRHIVAAAHPLAAEAGLAMLRQGGSAVDAAIAVQAMLTLV